MRLLYLKNSLEISRENYGGDCMAMWNVYGMSHLGIVDGSSRTLSTIKDIGAIVRQERSSI